mmetsp:Transcript_4127/g.15962  ORF Transcript_4127/g.15962 Transcript_4127/m.15962 type:complete len:252 (+) Transcript_4127:1934-2689(+)
MVSPGAKKGLASWTNMCWSSSFDSRSPFRATLEGSSAAATVGSAAPRTLACSSADTIAMAQSDALYFLVIVTSTASCIRQVCRSNQCTFRTMWRSLVGPSDKCSGSGRTWTASSAPSYMLAKLSFKVNGLSSSPTRKIVVHLELDFCRMRRCSTVQGKRSSRSRGAQPKLLCSCPELVFVSSVPSDKASEMLEMFGRGCVGSGQINLPSDEPKSCVLAAAATCFLRSFQIRCLSSATVVSLETTYVSRYSK